MLTEETLAAASTAELRLLKGRVERELAERERGEREAAERGEAVSGSGYRWEMVACGHAHSCNRCKSGVRHGPYLYRYYRKDGKIRSEYVKLAAAEAMGFERPAPFRPV